MTLQRRFRAALDTTHKAVMQRMRMDAACRELVETEDDFTDIAHRCGFADSAHFSRSLRESTGLSPGEYRTRMGL
jgi:transcriptional regulator GlxA family with amidase domain